jgi:hypothetical protein
MSHGSRPLAIRARYQSESAGYLRLSFSSALHNAISVPHACNHSVQARPPVGEAGGGDTWPLPYMMQEHQSTRRVMSPDLCLKAGEGQYLDHTLGVPLKLLTTAPTVATSITTPPCAPLPLRLRGALTATATITALPNVLASSHKCSTMRRASRQILS